MRDRSEDQITLVLIRHGSTKANRERRYLGRTDEALSREGRDALFSAQAAGIYPGIDILFSSPLTRCLETAGLLYPHLQPWLIPEWTEIDFGDFEGKNYLELAGDRRYQEWIDSGGSLPFLGGESRADFVTRCERGFFRMREILEEQTGNRVGAIVHGGTIMALLSRFHGSFCGGDYFDYQVPNGGGYECVLKPWRERPKVVHIKEIYWSGKI